MGPRWVQMNPLIDCFTNTTGKLDPRFCEIHHSVLTGLFHKGSHYPSKCLVQRAFILLDAPSGETVTPRFRNKRGIQCERSEGFAYLSVKSCQNASVGQVISASEMCVRYECF